MTAIELAAMAFTFGTLLSGLLFRRVLPWLLAAAGVAVMASLLINPVRWQLYPAAAALLLLSFRWYRRAPVGLGMLLGSTALAGLSAALLSLFAMPDLPLPSGRYSVGTVSHVLGRPSHDGPRQLYLKIWYPARATNGRPEGLWNDFPAMTDIPWYFRWGLAYLSHAPTHSHGGAPYVLNGGPTRIVLYNHSFVSWASENSQLAEELASRGMTVVAVRPLGEVDEYRRLDAAFARRFKPDIAGLAVATEMIRRRTEDSRFVVGNLGKVLSAIPGITGSAPPTYEAIGFSLGGAVSTDLCAGDPHCLAVANIDGAIPGVDYPHLPIPHYLMIYSGANFARFGSVHRQAQTHYRERIFDQAVHADFHDSATALPVTRWVFGRSVATLERERREVADMIVQFLENAAKDPPQLR